MLLLRFRRFGDCAAQPCESGACTRAHKYAANPTIFIAFHCRFETGNVGLVPDRELRDRGFTVRKAEAGLLPFASSL